jgi:hypothetical protein
LGRMRTSARTRYAGYRFPAEIIGLSYLAPDITQAILDGGQPRDLTADKLLAHSRLPLGWHEQRA